MTSGRRHQIKQLSELAREHGSEFLGNLDPETRREVAEMLSQQPQGETAFPPAPALDAEATGSPVRPGSQLGPYSVEALLGEGGMGQVFRARDSRLGRSVAIKVSQEAFTDRFEREARAIAALNHPNVCTLYDVGPNYLVMELVEGETLAARLKQGKLSIQQTLAYAIQIARALVAAHARGIVHRDLKPGNVVLTASGAKVLDFGLAKSEQDDPLTVTNVVLGTPAYMAPEQREGKPCDARADIFALGMVIYEMATGRRLPIGAVPEPGVLPERLAHVVERCLAPAPDARWQSARDVELELEWASAAPAPASPASASRTGRRGLVLVAGALLALAAAVVAYAYRAVPEIPALTATILPPEKTFFAFATNRGPVALSPDGTRMVFTATGDDRSRQLWVRALDSLEARPLPGTENATFPFWSPDSMSVGFFAGGLLKKVDTRGGAPVVLAQDAGRGVGASWGAKGQIVFAASTFSPLLKVSSDGGRTSVAAETEVSGHGFPSFLPDGEHFLFAAWEGSGQITLRVGSLSSTMSDAIGEAGSGAVYSSGHLLYLRGSSLMAQPFDVKALRLTGEPALVAEPVQRLAGLAGIGVFSVSATGLLAYQKGLDAALGQLTWIDRSGNVVSTLEEPRAYYDLELSPDGRTLMASSPDAVGNFDLWTYDLARGVRSRFTSDAAGEYFGRWSADGRSVVFNSTRQGHYDLYRKSANGAGPEEVLYADDTDKVPISLSHDGKFLLYYVGGGEHPKMWLLPLTPDRTGAPLKPTRLLPTQASEASARFSPDDRWVAYQTDESGRFEVYVAPFARPTEKHQISPDGGFSPRWRRDGQGLYYQAYDGRLREAEVRITADTVDVTSIRPVFSFASVPGGYGYDVSPDGQRVLAVRPLPQTPEPVTLIQNWQAKLQR